MLITDVSPQPPHVITHTVGRNSDSELRRMESDKEYPAQLSLRPTRAAPPAIVQMAANTAKPDMIFNGGAMLHRRLIRLPERI